MLGVVFSAGEYRHGTIAWLGVGVGALLRNQVAAVVLVLVILFVIDPAVAAIVEDYAKYSLSGLGIALSGGSGEDFSGGELLPVWAAALIWAGYTAALVIAAAALTARRDV